MGLSYSIIGYLENDNIENSFNIDKEYNWMKLNIKLSKAAWVQILLWDSNNVLRLQYLYGKSPQNIVISDNEKFCSSSVVPGIINEGKWKLKVISANIDEENEYSIDVSLGNEELFLERDFEPMGKSWVKYDRNMELIINDYNEEAKCKLKKWYKGDFHTHTNVSDGKLSPSELMEVAKKQNLDFFVITDHNIIQTGFPESEVLVIPGIEITSFKGHFNALGAKKWVDFTREGAMTTEGGMNGLLSEFKASGALCSMNHPALTPWAWLYKDTLLSNFTTVEVLNDPTFKGNAPKATEAALKLWNTMWNDGYKIWGIGGSDAHNLPTETYENSKMPSIIGDPATFVLADSLRAEDIMEAVKGGRVYVSRGLTLKIDIEVCGSNFCPGSDMTKLVSTEEKTIKYKLTIMEGDSNCEVLWIKDGTVQHKGKLVKNIVSEYEFSWKGEEYSWFRFEIRDCYGNLLAFANPIYKGFKNHKINTFGQLLKASGGVEFE
ncbi:CehA/McbA family metallohydrolase [Clostridium hydrogenum]|uniref:CehA/McbA family metallohydrolase n=1 Tax=Clostridium hydrogenum TaxID=2855764 RepID=UPI001F27A8A2|nr:CehA/McbA family metallohydrolase [Clostridium hydrogenum]